MADVLLLKSSDILDRLPHGVEHLCIDKCEVLDDMCVVTRVYEHGCKEVAGHFETNPVVPGHWLIEAMLQSSVFCPNVYSSGASSRVLRIKSADFINEVIPGNTVVFTTRCVISSGQWSVFASVGTVDGVMVCKAEFIAK